MNKITATAFLDEMEKLGGVRRLQRILRSGIKKADPQSPAHDGLREALARAEAKVDRRAERYLEDKIPAWGPRSRGASVRAWAQRNQIRSEWNTPEDNLKSILESRGIRR